MPAPSPMAGTGEKKKKQLFLKSMFNKLKIKVK
jgi:hypothetical protein